MSWVAAGLALLFGGCVIDSGGKESTLYEGCRKNSDCDGAADACYRIAWDEGDGRMCSRDCQVHADCQGGGACFALEGDRSGARICYAQCRRDADCDAGFRCVDALMEDEEVGAICLPW